MRDAHKHNLQSKDVVKMVQMLLATFNGNDLDFRCVVVTIALAFLFAVFCVIRTELRSSLPRSIWTVVRTFLTIIGIAALAFGLMLLITLFNNSVSVQSLSAIIVIFLIGFCFGYLLFLAIKKRNKA